MYFCAPLKWLMEIKNEKLASAEVSGFLVKNRLREYAMLSKLRLASSVVFSAIAGYLLGADTVQFSVIVALTIGGLMVVAASNAFNQVIEKDRDAKMDRTKDRPVAANRLSRLEAMLFASAVGLMGLWLLYYINPMSAMFGALSIFIYVLIYTPMKAVSGWAVFVGAFPGAIPFMLGWVAATNSFGVEPGTLFAIQFMWQFPHFWAIAWLVHDDYLKAGYNLLPTGKRDSLSAFLAVIYSVGLVGIEMLRGRRLIDPAGMTEQDLLDFKMDLPRTLPDLLPDHVRQNSQFLELLAKFVDPDPRRRYQWTGDADAGSSGLRIVHQQLAQIGRDAEYGRELQAYLVKIRDSQLRLDSIETPGH